MNRKAEKFFDAITHLREDLVEEAQDYVFRGKRTGWRRFGSLAACAVLVVSLGMLAALPRGCGSSGNGVSADSCAPMAPAEAPSDTNDGTSGTPSSGGDTNTAPSLEPTPADEPPSSEEAEQLRFFGQVLEVREDGLLAEPLDGFPADVERVWIPTAGLENLPEFYPGGVVDVSCGSISREGDGAVAGDVTAVWLVEP